MSGAEIGGYLISGIIGALLAAAAFAIALGGRVIRIETRVEEKMTGLDLRMASLERNLTALLGGVGHLLREDILDRARRERYDDDTRHNR